MCDLEMISSVMPHSGPMMLMSQLLHYDENGVKALAQVDEQHILLSDEGRLPSWAAMEFMAQAVALWSGYRLKTQNEPIRLGFLLGSRKLQLYFDALPVPCTLFINCELSMEDAQGFGVFQTELWRCDDQQQAVEKLAEGTLNVFSPKEGV